MKLVLFLSDSGFPLYFQKIIEQTSFEANSGPAPLFKNKFSSDCLNPSVIAGFEKKTGLRFAPEAENANVCMANSEEVIPQFRIHFSSIDLFSFILGAIDEKERKENIHLHYPKDVEEFWKQVQLGREKRQN